jgi:predicted alpha/beta hydrolase family esterase
MNKLAAWIKDYAHMFSAGTVMYFRRTPPKHYLGHVIDGKTPVIILPGIFGRWAFLKPLADHISLLGHPVYIVPKLGNNIGDIPTSVKKVSEVIKENNLKNVVIVAHSKGGLISKYLLVEDESSKKVKGVIAIATPFHGSSIGKFIPHYSIQELMSDSEIIRYLEKHSEVNGKIVSIIPSYDNHVWHSMGSHLEGALQNIHVDVAGHHKILNDKIVWNIVVEWIEKITKL